MTSSAAAHAACLPAIGAFVFWTPLEHHAHGSPGCCYHAYELKGCALTWRAALRQPQNEVGIWDAAMLLHIHFSRLFVFLLLDTTAQP